MDIKIKNLVAAGAAAAVNCRTCLDHIVPQCIRTGASNEDVRDAIETGFQVSRNARAKTRGCIDQIMTDAAVDFDAPSWECGGGEQVDQKGCC